MAGAKTALTVTSSVGTNLQLASVEKIVLSAALVQPRNFAPLTGVATNATPSVKDTPSIIAPEATAEPAAVTLPKVLSYSNVTFEDVFASVKVMFLIVKVTVVLLKPEFDVISNFTDAFESKSFE